MGIEAIFDPEKEQRPMNIVGFFSGGASSLVAVLEKQKELKKQGLSPFEVVLAFTDDPSASGIKKVSAYGVPIIVNDIEAYHTRQGLPGIRDREKRIRMPKEKKEEIRLDFDADNMYMIKAVIEHAKYNKQPDYCLLSGYMWAFTDNMLHLFRTIQNVHPADLTKRRADGRPRYVGDHAVHLAIKAGETETCSSIHIVTKDVDCGPVIIRSRPLQVVDLSDEIRADSAKFDAFCSAHQDKMKTACDIPAFLKAVEATAFGHVALSDGKAYLKTVEYPSWQQMPEGYQLRERT
jgi:folate-dependent phosphoribosylglycinamide formyltransferase PurN